MQVQTRNQQLQKSCYVPSVSNTTPFGGMGKSLIISPNTHPYFPSVCLHSIYSKMTLSQAYIKGQPTSLGKPFTSPLTNFQTDRCPQTSITLKFCRLPEGMCRAYKYPVYICWIHETSIQKSWKPLRVSVNTIVFMLIHCNTENSASFILQMGKLKPRKVSDLHNALPLRNGKQKYDPRFI